MPIISLKFILGRVLIKTNVFPKSGLFIAIDRNQVEKFLNVFFS